MSAVGIAIITIAIIVAGCLLGYAWGWQDAKVKFAGRDIPRGSMAQEENV